MNYLQFRNGIPFIRTWPLEPGDKVSDPDNTEEGCRKISNELSQHGIKNRIGYNPDSGIWSVAIINPNDYVEIGGWEIEDIDKIREARMMVDVWD